MSSTTDSSGPRWRRVAMIARWKPLHRGQAPVLAALCERAERALIGIGSANRYDLRNPFTAAETRAMVDLVLAGRSNYEVLAVDDLDDGPRWRAMVVDLLGELDALVTDNPYVASLLATDYRVIRPVDLVAAADRVPVDGTLVRRRMARGEDWRELVPAAVADYIERHGLDHRFRRQFGLATLALETGMEGPHVLVG